MSPVPNTSSAVIARLQGWAAARRWSKSRFAAVAGVVDTTLRDFHKPDWNPTRETLEKLEAVVPVDWQIGDPVPIEADAAATSATEAGRAAAS